jgi:hypothetical protein
MGESKGREGDEILLFAFRQADCPIPASVEEIGEFTADMLVGTIAVVMYAASNGDVQVRIFATFLGVEIVMNSHSSTFHAPLLRPAPCCTSKECGL